MRDVVNSILRSLIVIALLAGAVLATPESLKNGAPFEGEVDASLPLEAVLITFPGGAGQLPREVQGLTEVLSELFGEGPASMKADAYRKKLFLWNGRIDVRSGARAVQVVVSAPREHLAAVLELARELITAPHLDAETFTVSKDRALANAKSRFENMRSVIFYVSRRQAFDYHPDILEGEGSPKSIANVTLAKVKDYLPRLFAFERAFFSAMGPVPPAEVKASLETVFAREGAPKFQPHPFAPFEPAKYDSETLKVTIINRPGSTDTQVVRVQPEALRMDAPEKTVADVTHEIMGGGLTGRLGDTLRTKRGLTYHASSGFARAAAFWVVYSFAGDAQLPALLTGIPEVINAFREEKIAAKELEECMRKKVTEFKEENELPLQRLKERTRYRLYGLNPEFLEQYPALMAKVTPAEVEAFAHTKVRVGGGWLFLMGDQAKLRKALDKAGIPAGVVKVVEMDEIL